MSKITVAGAGTGGIVAALKLAQAGHDVTVYEKNKAEDCGYEQKDSFDASAMEFAGIDIPDDFPAPGNEITFYPISEDVAPLKVPSPEGYKNITVERKRLFSYLCSLATQAGVKFKYETEILGPVMIGSRVCGIKTADGNIYSDLVIDSCGMHSPVKKGLPDSFSIEKEAGFQNYLYSYRALFDKKSGEFNEGERYKIYVHSDTGFTWIITEEDCVDVLIVDFNEISYSKVADELHKMSVRNPQMGMNLLRNGKFAEIPVRQPAAVFVADGYAAVGDSAFMTYAVKGSGIAYSVTAGALLAKTVIDDTEGFYEAETLWNYEKEFFNHIGFDACRLALIKNLFLYFTADEINEIFSKKLVTSQELKNLITGEYQKSKLPGIIKDKIKLLGDVPEFRSQLLMIIGWLGKFALLDSFFPAKYSREDAAKWNERYSRFFDGTKPGNEKNESEPDE